MTEVIPESVEVLEHRLNDIVAFLRATLPEATEPADSEADETVRVSAMALRTVIRELDTEFLLVDPHGIAMNTLIAHRIRDVVEPSIAAATESYAEDMDFDPDYEYSFDVNVSWGNLLVSFDGDMRTLSLLAYPVTAALINGALWEDTNYYNIGYSMLSALPNVVEDINGMVAFQLLLIYINVVIHKLMPVLRFEVEQL